MELIARQVIEKREGPNCPQEILDEYADPRTEKYEQMVQDICKSRTLPLFAITGWMIFWNLSGLIRVMYVHTALTAKNKSGDVIALRSGR